MPSGLYLSLRPCRLRGRIRPLENNPKCSFKHLVGVSITNSLKPCPQHLLFSAVNGLAPRYWGTVLRSSYSLFQARGRLRRPLGGGLASIDAPSGWADDQPARVTGTLVHLGLLVLQMYGSLALLDHAGPCHRSAEAWSPVHKQNGLEPRYPRAMRQAENVSEFT